MKVTIFVLAGVIALFVTVMLAAFVVRSGRKRTVEPPPPEDRNAAYRMTRK